MSASTARRAEPQPARPPAKARPARRAEASTPQGGKPRAAPTPASQRHAPASKISVTVDANVLREVRKLIRASGASLSAHVTEALDRDLRHRRMASTRPRVVSE
jgi:hypothetical protein